ncbi:hypothetical protein TCAL_00608 [Tigriopus californicus]|uniref:C2H2-type domain-containing protein n=1 Tax=Tigriopus californicus TaxID=6832 RepID=A0A553PBM6_TIGCA|nr:uncharacterized protein LOC131876940 [Tigriopus californicus]TRY75091.1 hypothetical protein TCAL_00608 [Tigriopus californicus]|eukprot:TCALIF_00608-PA protein Name:"Protein of unknown function" AED:0.07 eAED:0.07 QI:497/1/1/1/1/1/4/205/2112
MDSDDDAQDYFEPSALLETSIMEGGMDDQGDESSHFASATSDDEASHLAMSGDHFLDSSMDASCSDFPPLPKLEISDTNRVILGSTCPVCEQPLNTKHSRDHVSWHFMEELRAQIVVPTQCPECDYQGRELEAVSRHLALFHNKLDDFLLNDELLMAKRSKCLAKPKKIAIGPNCMICGMVGPSREHVARHFMPELMDLIDDLPDKLQCPDCKFRGDCPQKLARHLALVHSKLDELLSNRALVDQRRDEISTKPIKVSIGDVCPVCDHVISKQHARAHVIWHFMDELKEMVNNFVDPTVCDLCQYSCTKMEKLAKHLALGHSKLDELLQDEDLIQRKRLKVLSTPKKEAMGASCPICAISSPTREHVARHFNQELNDYVTTLSDPYVCPECPEKSEKHKNLGIHLALVHGLLDKFLQDQNLIAEKIAFQASKPKKISLGMTCPICDVTFSKPQKRDHVLWHFLKELRDLVRSFADPQQCALCDYKSEKLDNMAQHLALGHSKLDDFLMDEELVHQKRYLQSLKPQKIQLGQTCPICDMNEPTREHVARHLIDELLTFIPNADGEYFPCELCEYQTDKAKPFAIHYGLVHGNLDRLLADYDLIDAKRNNFLMKPKKITLGVKCPICNISTKGTSRDHVFWHYIEELKAHVQSFPDQTKCIQCSYESESFEKLVRHVALGHSELDNLLQDEELLQRKRVQALSKPKKVSLGALCPICDFKDPHREHVARHFGEELNNIVLTFPDTTQCTDCQYTNDKIKNVAIHVALVHNILDQFLSDEELVAAKREAIISRPKRVEMGTECPVCDIPFKGKKGRDHVVRHFMDELKDMVRATGSTDSCVECTYSPPKSPEKMAYLARHYALAHYKLDEFIGNKDLVDEKREKAKNKPKRIEIGECCPICNSSIRSRDHLATHFLPELLDMAKELPTKGKCNLCDYSNSKLDNFARHLGLFHCKLDELMQNEELVAAKVVEASTKVKIRTPLSNVCVICSMTAPSREHMARHFFPELLALIKDTSPSGLSCPECEFSSTKEEYVARHYGTVHQKIDVFLLDEELVKTKAAAFGITNPVAYEEEMPMRSRPVRQAARRSSRRREIFEKEEAEAWKAIEDYEKSDSPPKKKSKGGEDSEEDKMKKLHASSSLLEKAMIVQGVDEEKIDAMNKKIKNESEIKLDIPQTPVPSSPNDSESSYSHSHSLLRNRLKQEENCGPTSFHAPVDLGSHMLEDLLNRPNEEAQEDDEEGVDPLADQDEMEGQNESVAMEVTPDMNMMMSMMEHDDEEERPVQPPKAAHPQHMRTNKPLPPLTKMDNQISPGASCCPVCDLDFASRGHIAGHFIGEITEVINSFPDPMSCPKCQFTSLDGTIRSVAIHIAVVHSQLDKYLGDKGLIARKRSELKSSSTSKKTDTHKPSPVVSAPKNAAANAKPEVYTSCPICNKDLIPTRPELRRSHVALHFKTELSKMIRTRVKGMFKCPECQVLAHTAEKIGLHLALQHNKLEHLLRRVRAQKKTNQSPAPKPSSTLSPPVALPAVPSLPKVPLPPNIQLTPIKPVLALPTHPVAPVVLSSAPFRYQVGIKCPFCDSSHPSRDHVAQHFVKEAMEHTQQISINGQCPECQYKSDNRENFARHYSLVHGLFDQFMSNGELVAQKRIEVKSQGPPKMHLGDTCIICGGAIPRKNMRSHVAVHFLEELKEALSEFPDMKTCVLCGIQNERKDKMAIHLALSHGKLDELLQDKAMIDRKKRAILMKPNKYTLKTCQICTLGIPTYQHSDHFIRHFQQELSPYMDLSQKKCLECDFVSPNESGIFHHSAMGHGHLENFKADIVLMQAKKDQYRPAEVKKLNFGSDCPLCQNPFTNKHKRDHVYYHFSEEFRQMVQGLDNPHSCPFCPYTNVKEENMAKHLAFGHSKLDEFMSDPVRVEQKKAQLGGSGRTIRKNVMECPVCGTQSADRKHIYFHFAADFVEMLKDLPDQSNCFECEYKTDQPKLFAQHLALYHNRLDDVLNDPETMERKRMELHHRPKVLDQFCAICDQPYSKKEIREHCARHFTEEVTAIYDSFVDQSACGLCNGQYKSQKKTGMFRHIALGHGKLDEFLAQTEMVNQKRKNVADFGLERFRGPMVK